MDEPRARTDPAPVSDETASDVPSESMSNTETGTKGGDRSGDDKDDYELPDYSQWTPTAKQQRSGNDGDETIENASLQHLLDRERAKADTGEGEEDDDDDVDDDLPDYDQWQPKPLPDMPIRTVDARKIEIGEQRSEERSPWHDQRETAGSSAGKPRVQAPSFISNLTERLLQDLEARDKRKGGRGITSNDHDDHVKEDDDVYHMSYEEWKKRHGRRRAKRTEAKEKALLWASPLPLSGTGEDEMPDRRRRKPLEGESLILRRPRPQMSHEEHRKLLEWMFPFAAASRRCDKRG